jgi:hypothetical protein
VGELDGHHDAHSLQNACNVLIGALNITRIRDAAITRITKSGYWLSIYDAMRSVSVTGQAVGAGPLSAGRWRASQNMLL